MNLSKITKDDIIKRSAFINLERLKQKGVLGVAQPQHVANKIKRYTGANVTFDECNVYLINITDLNFINKVKQRNKNRNQIRKQNILKLNYLLLNNNQTD